MWRAMMSVAPPGANGLMMRTALDGYAWACANNGAASAASRMRRNTEPPRRAILDTINKIVNNSTDNATRLYCGRLDRRHRPRRDARARRPLGGAGERRPG